MERPSTGTSIVHKAIKKAPVLKHPGINNWLIHLHYVRREFDICKSLIQEELQKYNGNCEYANYVLALIYRSEGKVQESLEKFQLCHQLEPTNYNTVKQIARSLFLLGRHKLAIDAYKKSQILHEDSDSETHYNMGMCYLYMGNLEKAQEHMNLSLQARVTQDALQALAHIALKRGNIQDAAQIYEKFARLYPEDADVLASLGVLYLKLQKDESAYIKLGDALAFDPHNTKALVAMGAMMQAHEDFDFSLKKYKTVVQFVPDSAAVWNNIGMCFFGKKKFVAAISCLKRAYYLAPFDWKILHNLGLVHLTMQQYASAFHFLTASINMKPNQSHTFMLLAVTIFHLEDPEYGVQAYQEAEKLNLQIKATDPIILSLNWAVSLFNIKRFKEAQQRLSQVEKLVGTKGTLVGDDVKEIFVRLKTALQMVDYSISDKSSQCRPAKKQEKSETQTQEREKTPEMPEKDVAGNNGSNSAKEEGKSLEEDPDLV